MTAATPTIDDLANLVNTCQHLGITPSTIQFQPSGITVWTQSLTARSDAERLASHYGAPLTENKARRRHGVTDWSADVLTRDKVAIITVNAASFDHHDDWQVPA